MREGRRKEVPELITMVTEHLAINRAFCKDLFQPG